MSRINVIGIDPSLRNWGMAKGFIEDSLLQITHIEIIQPVFPTGKDVRQSSKDTGAAQILFEDSIDFIANADAVFIEIPVGSQSARAMASYGICLGVIGSIMASNPVFQVSPTEVKMASVGVKTASKNDMIQWAVEAHPEAPWPSKLYKKESSLNHSKAEHMADAIAAIHAGMKLPLFQQLLSYRKKFNYADSD